MFRPELFNCGMCLAYTCIAETKLEQYLELYDTGFKSKYIYATIYRLYSNKKHLGDAKGLTRSVISDTRLFNSLKRTKVFFAALN